MRPASNALGKKPRVFRGRSRPARLGGVASNSHGYFQSLRRHGRLYNEHGTARRITVRRLLRPCRTALRCPRLGALPPASKSDSASPTHTPTHDISSTSSSAASSVLLLLSSPRLLPFSPPSSPPNPSSISSSIRPLTPPPPPVHVRFSSSIQSTHCRKPSGSPTTRPVLLSRLARHDRSHIRSRQHETVRGRDQHSCADTGRPVCPLVHKIFPPNSSFSLSLSLVLQPRQARTIAASVQANPTTPPLIPFPFQLRSSLLPVIVLATHRLPDNRRRSKISFTATARSRRYRCRGRQARAQRCLPDAPSIVGFFLLVEVCPDRCNRLCTSFLLTPFPSPSLSPSRSLAPYPSPPQTICCSLGRPSDHAGRHRHRPGPPGMIIVSAHSPPDPPLSHTLMMAELIHLTDAVLVS